MDEFTFAQSHPRPLSNNEMVMALTLPVDNVDPLNRTEVDGDALSLAPEYDMDRL